MSVINRMLLALAERDDHTVQSKLPGMVRAVPARLPKFPYRPWFLLALLIVAALFAGFQSWRNPPEASTAWTSPHTNPIAPPPALQLQAASTLASLPAADEAQAITVAPTPIPTPIPAAKPVIDRPHKTGQKFLLPARDEAPETDSSPSSGQEADAKRVSQAQQAD
jgi:type IV secretory pathway VirB10-like protein